VVNEYDHPVLAWVLIHWPTAIILPSLLLLLAGLALMTRWWNEKDEAARRANYHRRDR
jgi:hypothetical protein